MGVLNVTPDSFSDGGDYLDADLAIQHGLALVEDGAHLVDVGGESTRPGAEPVTTVEELRRVAPVVEGLVAEGVVVSVDTSKPEVAEAVLQAGAAVINDVTACASDGMAQLVADAGGGLVLMHKKGTPGTMQESPQYVDVVDEVEAFLLERVSYVGEAGVDRSRIVIDPGIGFGKTLEHNLELLGSVGRLASHSLPLMLGTSRKRFLATLAGEDSLAARDQATVVTTGTGFLDGARVFRVHNVLASRRALAVAAAIVAHQHGTNGRRTQTEGIHLGDQ